MFLWPTGIKGCLCGCVEDVNSKSVILTLDRLLRYRFIITSCLGELWTTSSSRCISKQVLSLSLFFLFFYLPSSILLPSSFPPLFVVLRSLFFIPSRSITSLRSPSCSPSRLVAFLLLFLVPLRNAWIFACFWFVMYNNVIELNFNSRFILMFFFVLFVKMRKMSMIVWL